MKLEPFLLDQWLDDRRKSAGTIDYDLASSTGPRWTARELMELADEDERERLLDTPLGYATAAGSAPLREAIGEMCGVNPEHVQIVTGASEALLILFFLAAESGANVVMPFPCFPPFSELSRCLGLEARYYRLRPENGYRPEADEIRSLVDSRTRFILVNSPHNPTGSIMSWEELRRLHDFSAERGIQFIADEVYHPIYHGEEVPSAAALPHATVLGDFSKALSLGGLRVGWMIERDSRLIEQYLNARSYFTLSNTTLGEAMAAIAVRYRDAILERARQASGANLKLLDHFFHEHRDALGWVRPRGGTTAFPWLKSGEDSRRFCESAARRGLLLAPGDCFGMPSHFRLGFGACQQFPVALERFASSLRHYSARVA